jgi:hypothetical protein
MEITHLMSSFGISEQYPAAINNRRKNLYPIMREAKQQRHHVVLVSDHRIIIYNHMKVVYFIRL